MNVHQEAARIAEAAGRELTALRARGFADGADAEDLRAAADRLAHAFIVKELATAFPGDPVLSEEGRDDPARLASERVWIVDPLDGTREFAEPGRSDWAVHVALWEAGELRAGAVALPALAVTLSTASPSPAVRTWQGRPRLLVSRTRPPALSAQLAEELGGDLLAMGSAGAKAMAVVRGQAEIYAHGGGQYEWDSAAPVAVALAAGLHASRLDGSALVYNASDPWLPDLLICHQDRAGAVLEAVARCAQPVEDGNPAMGTGQG